MSLSPECYWPELTSWINFCGCFKQSKKERARDLQDFPKESVGLTLCSSKTSSRTFKITLPTFILIEHEETSSKWEDPEQKKDSLSYQLVVGTQLQYQHKKLISWLLTPKGGSTIPAYLNVDIPLLEWKKSSSHLAPL